MTQLDTYQLADPKWFSKEFSGGSEDPYGGAAPLWLDNGVATYTPPAERTTLLGDFLNRTLYASKTNRFFSVLGWADSLWGATINNYDDGEWSEKLGKYDPTKDWEAIPESTRLLMERQGWTLDAAKKVVSTPGGLVNWFRDGAERIQLDSDIEALDNSSGWARYVGMKFASASINYIGSDPSNILLGGAGAGLKAAGLGVRSTTASILAGGATLGALGSLDTFDNEVRWNVSHGLMDWEDVEALDYLSAAGVGAAFGTAFAALPAAIHYRKFGWAGSAHTKVADAAAGQTASSGNPTTAAMFGQYNTAREALSASLRDRFGQVESAPWRKALLEPSVWGMSESEHLSFIQSLASKIDEYRPTQDELIKWIDPNGTRVKADLDAAPLRRFREQVIAYGIGEDPSTKINQLLSSRYGKNADKFSFLSNPDATRPMGFENQEHVLDWLRTADARDIRDAARYRRPDERLLLLQGEYRQGYDRLVASITKMARKNLDSKKVAVDLPAFRGEDIKINVLSRSKGAKLTAEQRRDFIKTPFSGGPEMVGNRIPDLTPERVPNIVATRTDEAVFTARRQSEILRNQIANLRRVIDDPSSLTDRKGLKRILGIKEAKLEKTLQVVSKAEAKAARESKAIGPSAPTKSVGLAREADGIAKKLARLDPNDPQVPSLRSRLAGIEARLKIAPNRIRDPIQSVSAVPVETVFTQTKSRLDALRKQAASLATTLGDDPKQFTPTQRKILDDINAEITSTKKRLAKDFGWDADANASIPRKATTSPAGASRSPTATIPPPTASDAIRSRLLALDGTGDDYVVQRGMTFLNDVANLPGVRVVSNLLRRAALSRTGQIKTVYNGTAERIRYAIQRLDNTNIVHLDTKKGKGRVSLWHVKKRNESQIERHVQTTLLKAAQETGLPSADVHAAVRAVRETGVASQHAAINDAAASIGRLLDRYAKDGIDTGVLTKTRDRYIPVVHKAAAIRGEPGRFAQILASKLTKRWSASNEINRAIAADLGWLAKGEDGMVVTQAGRDAGITESWPELQALTPQARDAYLKAMPDTMLRLARESRDKMTGTESVILDEMHDAKVLDANGRQIAARQRMFDEEILKDPDLQEFFEQDLLEILHLYGNTTGLRIAVAKELKREFGVAVSFKDVINEIKKDVYAAIKTMDDARAQKDAEDAFAVIENKYDSLMNNRPPAHSNATLSPALVEIGMNVSRTVHGGKWGLYSATQELLGQLFRARSVNDFGRSVANAVRALTSDTVTKSRMLGQVGYGFEMFQHSVRHSMSATVDSVHAEIRWWDRIRAPYQKAARVVTGREVPSDTVGGGGVGRVLDSVRAVTEAAASTSVEAGGVRIATGWARFMKIADTQARLIDDLPKLGKLMDDLDAINLNDMGPRERMAVWRRLAADHKIPVDDLVAMNARGLLDREFISLLGEASEATGLKKRDGNWFLDELQFTDPARRERWLTEHENRLSDFLLEAVDESVVNPRPMLRNTDAMHWTDFMLNEMQTYARSFGAGLGYRTVNQMSLPKAASIFIGFAFGEALAKTILGISQGQMSAEEAQRLWTEEPGRMAYRSISGVPFMGVWTSLGLDAVKATYDATVGNPRQRRSGFGSTPMTSLLGQLTQGVTSTYADVMDEDKEIDPQKVAPFLNLIPGWGAWWFQSGLTASGLNPRKPKD